MIFLTLTAFVSPSIPVSVTVEVPIVFNTLYSVDQNSERHQREDPSLLHHLTKAEASC